MLRSKEKLKIMACFLFSLSLCFLLFFPSQKVLAFESSQMEQCIAATNENPVIHDQPEIAIKNYCSCALDLIIDQNQPIRDSGYECAVKNFNG